MSRPGMARGWIWVGIALVVALLYLPLIPPVLFSLVPENASEGRITLRWYEEMWKNAPTLALVAAMAIRELRVPRLVLLLMLLPLFVPGVSMGLATALFFRILGVAPSLATIALVQILWALPFATLVVLTAMSTFDPIYLEAAYMSGANRWRAFRDIELPLIWPGISGAATFSLILSFNETIRTSIVQGPLNTVQTYIWSTYKQIGLSPTLYALMTLLITVTVGLVGTYLVRGMRRA
jgi:spermidine/putrescine transport system permease protein